MSDFDKEAERQRLREKYEEDEQEREVTQQMSELLLRGATMTNKHCERCQNPVFRYEGEEFCPVCQGAVEGEAGQGQAQGEAGQAQARGEAGQAQTEPGSPGETATEPGAATEFGDGAAETAGTPSVGGSNAGEPEPETGQTGTTAQGTGAHTERDLAEADDLGEARASLVRTLTDLAGRAESAGDVGRQRDLLAAAREAAEAIEALDRAR